MAEHFAIVTTARDWLIDGNLAALAEPMTEFAAFEYREVAPGGWLDGIAQLQQAARLTAAAHSLDLAATGVATMARVCGECHQAMGRGPHFAALPPDRTQPARDSMHSRMDRHMWAADRMWEGLTGPSDAAWLAGASALAAAPEAPPRAGYTLPAPVIAALAELRELGSAAVDAQGLAARADVYGLFLASCSECHSHAQAAGPAPQ